MSDRNAPEVLAPNEIYSPKNEPIVYFTRPKPRYWLHALLLMLTFLTTLIVGSRLEWNFLRGVPPFVLDDGIFPVRWALQGHHLLLGIPFSLTLMLILLAHEMGHYLYCVKYRVAATLPFFIPFPTLFGTMGAFIRIRSPLRSRSVLFDIGIAGPIAGFVVALVVLVFSLGLSHPTRIGGPPADIQFGYPLVFYVVQEVLMLTGRTEIASLPLSAFDLHPVAIASWVGMFATALNLLPGGQLDGGHIIYSISPRAHKIISQLTILVLIPLGVYSWMVWLLWAIFLRITGARHPWVPLHPEISSGRRWLALVALIMLVLTITPAPVRQYSLYEIARQLRSPH